MKAILLFTTLTLFVLFSEQNTVQAANAAVTNQNSTIAIGDTVSEIDDSILSVFQDKNNTFWFGSNGDGVYRYDRQAIVHFTTKDGLCNNQIWKIQGDQSGDIFFTTGQGISKFDGLTFSTLSALSNSEWKLEPDDLWFQGAQDSGVVYRYDGTSLHQLAFPETELGEAFIAKFPRSKYPAIAYSPYDVYSIFRDSKGSIWFGTTCLGVCRYDGKSFTWITEGGLTESPVRCIIEDKDGNFWFGNSGQAVYRYDGENIINIREEKGIGNVKDGRKDLPVSYMSIIKDNNDELWIVTLREGVWRYDGENITHYPIKDGNTNITLFSIYKDNQGDLWLGTHDAGAYKFNGTAFEKFRF